MAAELKDRYRHATKRERASERASELLDALCLTSEYERKHAIKVLGGRRRRGVSGRTAVGHAGGKLISVLFYCLRHGQPYDISRPLIDRRSR